MVNALPAEALAKAGSMVNYLMVKLLDGKIVELLTVQSVRTYSGRPGMWSPAIKAHQAIELLTGN
jgi:hypothetical protein